MKQQSQLNQINQGDPKGVPNHLLRAAANAVLIADGPCSQGENAGFTRDKDRLLGDHPRIFYRKKQSMFPDTRFLSEKVDTYK